MKKFTNQGALFNAWAHQLYPNGVCGNVSFEGGDLFSYRAKIATFLPNGQAAVSRERYSITTAKHQYNARSAVAYKYISVPCLGSVEEVINASRADAEILYGKLTRARTKYFKAFWESKLREVIIDADAYAQAMGSSARFIPKDVDQPEPYMAFVLLITEFQSTT